MVLSKLENPPGAEQNFPFKPAPSPLVLWLPQVCFLQSHLCCWEHLQSLPAARAISALLQPLLPFTSLPRAGFLCSALTLSALSELWSPLVCWCTALLCAMHMDHGSRTPCPCSPSLTLWGRSLQTSVKNPGLSWAEARLLCWQTLALVPPSSLPRCSPFSSHLHFDTSCSPSSRHKQAMQHSTGPGELAEHGKDEPGGL